MIMSVGLITILQTLPTGRGGQLVLVFFKAAEFLDVKSYVHVMRWAKSIDARLPYYVGVWLMGIGHP